MGCVECLCDAIFFGFIPRREGGEGEEEEKEKKEERKEKKKIKKGRKKNIPIWGSRCMSPSVHICLSAEILVRICEGSWGEAQESSPL